jgi:hypothetical protein
MGDGRGGGGGGGEGEAKSYDGEKAWISKNHSIFSDLLPSVSGKRYLVFGFECEN